MKERCSSRSLSRQLQAALHSSQGEAYLQQLGISPSSGNGANAGNSEQPDASSSTSRERSEDQHATRTTKDVSIQQLLAPLESSKLSKDLGGPRPKEEPQPSQGTALPSDQNRHDSETAAKKAQAKAAKAERDARMREGAAKYQEILAKGPPKPKPGLLERIAIIKAEKVGRETNVEDASDTAMQPVEAALDKRQRAQDKPPVWSTSLQDLRTADELCPDAETKKGKVGVKLSRGKIARAVLFADSTSTQNQRLDGRGEVYFDVVVSMSKKRSPVGGTQQNGQAGNTGLTATSRRSKKLGDPDRQPSASEMLEAAAEPAPPPRRSFMERRMARGWAYQQTPRDVVVPQSAPQSELKPMPLPEPVFRDPTTDDSALGPPEPIGKQEASTDAVEAHEVSMSSVTAPDEVAHPSQALPVPKASKEARDASIEGLVEAYRLETPVYLYLAGKCKCTGAADAATSCSGGESCGALRLLPCKLPNRVEALGVGWTTIVDLEVLVLPQPTIRFYLRIDSSLEKEPWWWLPVPPTLRGWKLPRNPPSNTHQPAAHRPDGLLSALACTSCHATVLRQHWQGWTCAHCSLSVPATALSSDYDVDWGKMPILTEGPRMDNGRVLCIPPISRTDIKTWDDGIKVVDYLLPAAKSQSAGMILRDAGTGEAVEQRVVQSSGSDVRLHHFLSCGDWRRTCDKLLQDLLDPTMPYERTPGSNGRLRHFFSTAFFLTAQSTSQLVPFLPSPVLDVGEHSAAANTLLDAVDAVETLLSRMNVDTKSSSASSGSVDCSVDSDGRTVVGLEGAAPLMPFSTLTTTVVDVKDKLELLAITPAPTAPPSSLSGPPSGRKTSEDQPGKRRQIAYLHLGSPAAMLISTTRKDPLASTTANVGAGASAKNRRPFQLLFSCMVAHGDVVLIRCAEEDEGKDGSEYKIIVETQKLHVGLVFT